MRRPIRRRRYAIFPRIFQLGLLLAVALPGAEIDPRLYTADVRYLSSPELKGRATGSPELEKAAAYIAADFKSFGLAPPDGKNYQQAFPVKLDAHLGPDNRFEFAEKDVKDQLQEGRDFAPFRFSSSGKISGSVVFAGYGITAPDLHYDDYAGIDVKDKIVLLLRHEPQENDPKSVFDGTTLTSHATFVNKAVNAKMHGARAVIIVNDVAAHSGKDDQLEDFGKSSGPNDIGIPFVQMKAAAAEHWLAAEGRDLRKIEEGIDRDLKPQSLPLLALRAELDVDVRRDTKTVHNVAGFLPGETSEYVVIGAHYDHLGLGDENSLAPSQIGTIHPGADDNASGTAGVIELARWFSKEPKHKRGILFLAFAGEELGLLGSEWYVNHPILPLKDDVAMINMDMIGRISGGRVFLSGEGTGSTFARLMDDVKPPGSIHLDFSDKTGYGASDHTSFTTKQVPVLFFFSGLHADYHKPSDTADKINATDAATLLEYVAELTDQLASDPDRPKFIHVAEPSNPVSASGGGSGYGPNFGSIPDFNEPPKGVRFADVRDGTPAAKAGLKAGDILIEFDGKEIGNLYDFTYALRAHKAGDLVLVKVLRGSQTIEAKVLLTERR